MNALPLPVALADVLARGDVWRGDTLASLPEATIPSGYPELDAELPGGGWPRGGLSEFLVERSSVGELSLLCRPWPACPGRWLAGPGGAPWLPHAPAWAAAGVVPERLVIVRTEREVAWSVEQLLLCGGFAAVLAWPDERIDAGPCAACRWRPKAGRPWPACGVARGLPSSHRRRPCVSPWPPMSRPWRFVS
jgi:cell division inhibitor SulA/protein ImuA